jgi:hypothetical protein
MENIGKMTYFMKPCPRLMAFVSTAKGVKMDHTKSTASPNDFG